MNTRNLLAASLAGGLISLVLVNTPYVNFINLLLCVGYWIGPIAAVWLYRRLDVTMTLKQAMLIGLLAGAWHGLFGAALSPMGLAGAGGMMNALQPFVSAQDWPDVQTALTGVGGILFNLVGMVFDIGLGFLGGLIGGLLLRTDRVANKSGVQI